MNCVRELGKATCFLVWLIAIAPAAVRPQAPMETPQSAASYRLNVAVDEVVLTFHAADSHGLPVNDLKLEEMTALDNGKRSKVLRMDVAQDHPIRAGILIDTSDSMRESLARNREIAGDFAERLLRQQTDRAFVMDFGYVSKVLQPWTIDASALRAGAKLAVAGRENPLGGTALYDALYRACFYQFGKTDHAATGNLILLFSDGEDNASHTTLQEVANACQGTNTAIYAFRPAARGSSSTGPGNLRELTALTGGSVFYNDDADEQMLGNLRTIEANLRNEYRLIYRPAELKRDGAFHRIELRGPERVDSMVVRSGYYAPDR